MEPPRPANGFASENSGGGTPSLRPSAPLTEPNNRMVAPEVEGHGDFSFLGAAISSFAFYLHCALESQGAEKSRTTTEGAP
jgi:hypothetical protein